ncbi:MAG: hypothetical protein KAI79_11780 [Bacteroidales bacterium]|nr:hypothetical protein [Bacteroidales bacterium]
MNKTCAYCNDIYQPRPQVKNPKACKKSYCQKQRQKDNERSWHQKNKILYDAKYAQIQRKIRAEKIKKMITKITNALAIGLRFNGEKFNENFNNLTLFLADLGIRQLNKFCIDLLPPQLGG